MIFAYTLKQVKQTSLRRVELCVIYWKVGLIAFSKDAKVEFHLNSYKDQSSLLAAIRNVGYMGQNTNTHLALNVRHTGTYYNYKKCMLIQKIKLVK